MSDIRRTDGSGNTHHCFRDDHQPWRESLNARQAAHTKHGDNSIEALPWNSDQWLRILVEEVGEAAHEITYDGGGRDRLRAELVDVLAVGSAWLAAVDQAVGAEPS